MKFTRTTRRELAKRRSRRPDAVPTYPGAMKRHSRERGGDSFVVRRFDAAVNNQINRHRWVNAHGQSINVDLQDLPGLQAYCSHLAANNPLVKGALDTVVNDTVGRRGPKMQVVSDDREFNERVEAGWRPVWEMPDPAGVLSGPENLKLWVRLLHTAGAYLNVFANVRRPGRVTFGWKTIHPRRLVNPLNTAGRDDVAFGVRLSAEGRPLEYYIADRDPANSLGLGFLKTRPYSADIVQHRFIAEEPEQVTGYPELTAVLDVVGDLAEYQRYVMEAAKLSAAHTPFLHSHDPKSVINPDPLPAAGYKVRPGEVHASPKGWTWSFPTSTQPGAQYKEFRHECLRDFGVALGMPLMMVLLSSGESNFASAHYDGAVYLRRLQARQSWIERMTLNQLVEQVVQELVIGEGLRRPSRYRFVWTWETPPYVNPEKQQKADRMALEDGGMSLVEYCSKRGDDWEEVVDNRARVNESLRSKGLPPAPVNHGSGTPSDTLRQVADRLDDDETTNEESDADRTLAEA